MKREDEKGRVKREGDEDEMREESADFGEIGLLNQQQIVAQRKTFQ